MKKGGIIGVASFIAAALTGLASAQLYSGYGFFSISSIVPFAILVFFFALTFALLSRLRFPPAITGVMAGSVSFLIYYYGFYQTNFDLSGLFLNFGISSGAMYPVLSAVLLVFAIFVVYLSGRRTIRTVSGPRTVFSFWGGISGLFFMTGLLLLGLLVFTDIFYSGTIIGIIGAGMVIASLFFWNWSRRGIISGAKIGGSWAKQGWNFAKEHHNPQLERRQLSSQWTWIIVGILITILGAFWQIWLVLIGLAIFIIGVILMRRRSEFEIIN